MSEEKTFAPFEADQPNAGWMRALMADDWFKSAIAQGMVNFSIEGLIRLCFQIDASKRVEITSETLVKCLTHLAGDDIHPNIKSLALAILAAALDGQEGAYRLELKQQSAGRQPPQTFDTLEQTLRWFYIARDAEAAEARGARSPNKEAARQNGCTLAEVKRARAYIRNVRAMAEAHYVERTNSNN